MFQNKKLAQPVKCQNFRGDNNDDIPMQMTEDHPANIITHTFPDGGYQNTMVSDSPKKEQLPTGLEHASKQIQNSKKLQKNMKNFTKL